MMLKQLRYRLVRLSDCAFTVVELLVAVSIMTLIVLALYSMFDQTQKALRGNASQVDVLEGGRAAMELITRELEQMRASGLPGCTNLWVEVRYPLTYQHLVNANVWRTNVLEEFFFISQFNKQWSGIGYKVLTTNGVGTLYRFSTNIHVGWLNPIILSSNWTWKANTNNPDLFQRVTDGIIHFRLKAFDALGQPIVWWNDYSTITNMTVQPAESIVGKERTAESRYVFRADLLPAYVELEMAILEPHVLERFKSIANAQMQGEFFARQAGAIHLFQQRIPIRVAQ